MTQQVLDDEDQMAQALAEIRNDRSEQSDAVVVNAPQEVAKDGPAVEALQPEPQEAPAAKEASPDEQLKAAQAELHKMRSEIGRVGALNRKYMEAAQEASALREKLAHVQQATSQHSVDASTASKLDAVAEQVKEFPELAGIVAAVSEALKHADKKTEEVARRVAAQAVEPLEPLRQEHMTRAEQERNAARDAALQAFNSTYPTAAQVASSDEFRAWVATQPSYIQHAFFKGEDPQDAMTVMDSYDMHLRRIGREPVARISNSQPDAQAAMPKTAPNVNRLQRAAGIPSRPSGSQGGVPPSDDFDASLAYFRNKRLSAQRATA